jgi:hypothetical protein
MIFFSRKLRFGSTAFLTLLAVVATFQFATSAPAAEVIDGWTVVTRNGEVTIYSRPRKGSSLLELKGVSVIDAEPMVVKRVIDDVLEYPKFMPYVAETKILSNSADQRVSYQRLAPPIVGERDYTVRVRYETKPCPTGGTIYCNRWEVANDLGPAEKRGVTRVKVTEGSWLLEPGPTGKTRATYTIYSDSGGGIPTFILNSANKTAIPKLFEAVRKQAKLEKYSRKNP